MKVLLGLLLGLVSCSSPHEEEGIDYNEMVMATPEEEWTSTLEGKDIVSDLGPDAQEVGNLDFEGPASTQ